MAFDHVVECRFIGNRQRCGENRQREAQPPRKPLACLIGADALAIITEWSVFRTPSFRVMRKLLKAPVVFDGRNLYDLDLMKENGFYYESIGRTTIQRLLSTANHI